VPHAQTLETVRQLSTLRENATAERVVALRERNGAIPADVESVRATLEGLASDGKLGRLEVAALVRGCPIQWKTAYFPVA
jgi:hypothetical protein